MLRQGLKSYKCRRRALVLDQSQKCCDGSVVLARGNEKNDLIDILIICFQHFWNLCPMAEGKILRRPV